MLWLFLLSPFVMLNLGIWAGGAVHRRTGSVFLSSAAFTFFFGFGIVINRIGLPVPALILIGYELYDTVFVHRECVMTSEGCDYGTPEGDTVILLPWLIQWAWWFIVFGLGRFLFRFFSGRYASSAQSRPDA